MVNNHKLILLINLLVLISASFPAFAQTPTLKVNPADLEKQISPEDALSGLFAKVMENPDNMDINFSYAQLATRMGRFDEAIAAYERILITNPSAQRVKMEMAVVYSRMGNMLEAHKIAVEVVESEIPVVVKKNVIKFIASLEKGMKRHRFSGSVTMGINSDSNANSAPMSGLVETADLGIGSLTEDSRRASDDHRFIAINVGHSYLMSPSKKHTWDSSVTLYKTHQSSMSNLDLTSASIKMGPKFVFPQTRTVAGANITYSDINLGEANYLLSSSIEPYIEHVLHPKLKLKAAWKREHRRFRNTPTATTYELKNGRANQQVLSATVVATPKDIVNVSLAFRQESTKLKYNNNRQLSTNIGYTHMFPNDYFANAGISYKKTNYQDYDTVISTTKIRNDRERTMSLMVGKKFNKKMTGNVAYQYRDVSSNIINYEYENERVTAAVTYNF